MGANITQANVLSEKKARALWSGYDAAKETLQARGYTLYAVTDRIMVGNKSADGLTLFKGKIVLVQIDSKQHSANSIFKHEHFHVLVREAGGAALFRSVKARMMQAVKLAGEKTITYNREQWAERFNYKDIRKAYRQYVERLYNPDGSINEKYYDKLMEEAAADLQGGITDRLGLPQEVFDALSTEVWMLTEEFENADIERQNRAKDVGDQNIGQELVTNTPELREQADRAKNNNKYGTGLEEQEAEVTDLPEAPAAEENKDEEPKLSAFRRNDLIGRTFLPYDESQSDTNERATRWAHQEDVQPGDTEIFFYHDAAYLVEAIGEEGLGYRVVTPLTNKQYNRLREEFYGTRTFASGESDVSEAGADRSLDPGAASDQRRDASDDRVSAEHGGENPEVPPVDRNAEARGDAERRSDGDRKSGDADRQGTGAGSQPSITVQDATSSNDEEAFSSASEHLGQIKTKDAIIADAETDELKLSAMSDESDYAGPFVPAIMRSLYYRQGSKMDVQLGGENVPSMSTDALRATGWSDGQGSLVHPITGKPIVLLRADPNTARTVLRDSRTADAKAIYLTDDPKAAEYYALQYPIETIRKAEMYGEKSAYREFIPLAAKTWEDAVQYVRNTFYSEETGYGFALIPRAEDDSRIVDNSAAVSYDLMTNIEDRGKKVSQFWHKVESFPANKDGLTRLQTELGTLIDEQNGGVPAFMKFYVSSRKMLTINANGDFYQEIHTNSFPAELRDMLKQLERGQVENDPDYNIEEYDPDYTYKDHDIPPKGYNPSTDSIDQNVSMIDDIAEAAFVLGYDCVHFFNVRDTTLAGKGDSAELATAMYDQYAVKSADQVKSIYNPGNWGFHRTEDIMLSALPTDESDRAAETSKQVAQQTDVQSFNGPTAGQVNHENTAARTALRDKTPAARKRAAIVKAVGAHAETSSNAVQRALQTPGQNVRQKQQAVQAAEGEMVKDAAQRLGMKGMVLQDILSRLGVRSLTARHKAAATLRNLQQVEAKRNQWEIENGPITIERNDPVKRQFREKVADEARQLRTKGRTFYKNFVAETEALERFAQRQLGSGTKADTLINIARGANSTVDHVLRNGLVDRSGDAIRNADGKMFGSLSEATLCYDDSGKVDMAKQKLLHEYLLYRLTEDRMSIESRMLQMVENFEAAHPELAQMTEEQIATLNALTEKEAAKQKQTAPWQTVQEYCKLLQAFNKAQNKPVLADNNGIDVTAKTAKAAADAMLRANPWLEEKANALYEWNDAFMQAWAVGDSITQETYDLFKKMYPHYVPAYRVGADGPGGGVSMGLRGLSISAATKAAKGSTMQVDKIENNFARKVSQIIRQARSGELFRNVIDTLMTDDGTSFGDFGSFNWDGLSESRTYIDAEGKPITADPNQYLDDATDLVDNNDYEKLPNGDYRISAWYNGQVLSAYVSKELYEALGYATGKIHDRLDNVAALGQRLTAPMKTAITGVNPMFAIRNVVRDVPTACINSISGLAFPKYMARAIVEMGAAKMMDSQTATALAEALNLDLGEVQNAAGDNWHHFVALGGTHAGYYNNENGFIKAINEQTNWWGKAKAAAGALNEATESVTRFAEYLATIDRLPGGDTLENRLQGIKNAAEVTVDFSRHGKYGKVLNAWIPYWNPAVQGVDKVVRSVIESKDGSAIWKQAARTLGRAAMTTVLFEAILQAVLRATGRKKDWDELSDRTKDTYYCIPLAQEGQFLKIPKNREWGAILGTSFMRMLEAVGGREDPFAHYVEDSILPNFLPDGPMEIFGISQAVHIATNKDFAGRRIVPYDLEDKSAKNQWNEDTALLTKQLGQLFNFSPVQIDYILGDYFGDFYKMYQKATSGAVLSGEDSLGELLLKLVEQPWVADNRYSNQKVSDYYDLLSALDTEYADSGNDQTSEVYAVRAAVKKRYGNQITELNKKVRALPDSEEKDAAKQQIAQLAAEALQYAKLIRNGTITDPILRTEYEDRGLSPAVTDELIRLDKFSGKFKFQPSGKPSASYTDPKHKKQEYVLTDEQKEQYTTIYNEVYEELMSQVIDSAKYRNADDEAKLEQLVKTKENVAKETKEQFFGWLTSQGVKSTKKKTSKDYYEELADEDED